MKPTVEYIYDGLLHPVKLYSEIVEQEEPPIVDAFFMVLLINFVVASLIYAPRDIGVFNMEGSSAILLLNNVMGFILSLIMATFMGVITWISFSLFMGMLATIFQHNSSIKLMMTLSAFSGIPVLFLPMINMFKITGEPVGIVIAVLLNLACWIWCGILFLIAIIKAYKMSFTGLTMLVISPFITGMVLFICCIYMMLNLFILFK